MKMTAQEEYGLRCLLRLGRTGPGASLTIPEIARQEGISGANVAKMMRILRKGGLVKSARGKDGGYTLSRPAHEIAVGEALAVLGGRLYDARFCEQHAGGTAVECTNLGDCSIRSVWQRLQNAIDGVLRGMTLQDLLGRRLPEEPDTDPAPRRRALPLYQPRG
jgi:Rrf2 family protein